MAEQVRVKLADVYELEFMVASERRKRLEIQFQEARDIEIANWKRFMTQQAKDEDRSHWQEDEEVSASETAASSPKLYEPFDNSRG